MEALYVIALSVGAYLTLFILTKIMGYRELSELTFLDYIIGITIGSIGAELATNVDESWWRGVLAMSCFAGLEILLSYLSRKSNKVRAFVSGKPIIIMKNGQIQKQALKKAQIDINDLLCQAREQGYFDLSSIDYAIMEINGKISFLPTVDNQAPTLKDLNINKKHSGLCTNLIIDGDVIKENLEYAKLTDNDLIKILKKRNLEQGDVLLLTYDESGNVEYYKK